MDMAWLSNYATKNRSSTFGAYDSLIGDEGVPLSKRHNLVVSSVRSVVSGVGGIRGRKRSSTWHGAPLQVKQISQEEDSSSKCVASSTVEGHVPSLKEILCKIITEELNNQLENETGLKSSDEFVEKSAMVAKIISTKARRVVCCNTKIVSSVFIGEIRENGIEVASQCLFDPTQDAFASGNFKSAHIFAVGMLFATTYEAHD